MSGPLVRCMESGNLNKESRETASKTLVGAVGPPTPDLSAPEEEEFTRRRKGAEGGTCGPLVRGILGLMGAEGGK